jgi:uncharacterized DUF497 family protein
MASHQNDLELLSSASFEWDDQKSQLNLAKHGIDFEDVIGIFDEPILLVRSDRDNEVRWIAVGSSESRVIAVVFTRRDKAIRIISARRARKNEEREYRNAKMERPPQRQD